MLIPVLVQKKLSKDIKEDIKSRRYSENELKDIYNNIVLNQKNAKSDFITNAIIFLLVFGFIAYQIIKIDKTYITFGVAFGLVCYLTVIGIFYLNITSAKRHFSKLVKYYYSDIYEKVIK